MISTRLVRRAPLAGAVAVAALVVTAGCSNNDAMNHDGTTAGAPSTGSSGKTFNESDVAFAQMMIPHHQQAVEMATLAGTRAKDPEIKQIAAQVNAAQQAEITTMTSWLQGWQMPTMGAGGHSMPGMGNMTSTPGMASEQEIAQLKAATGVDFDRMFARMMIAHHNGAIQMCRDVREQGTSSEVKGLATTIERAQVAEVAAFEKILDRL